MLFIWLTVAVTAIAMIWIFAASLKDEGPIKATGYALGSGFMVGLVSFIAIVLIVGCVIVGSIVGKHLVPGQSKQLLNLSASSSTSGSFFLGSGVIDSTPVFFYYQRDPNGSITLQHIRADRATVIEGSGDPAIVYQNCVSNNALLNPQFMLDDCGPYVTFHIPAGSVVTNYKLGG